MHCLLYTSAFYHGTEIRDKALIGHRDGQEYNIMDDKAVLEFFAANCEKDTKTFVTSFLGNEDFFGQDLNKVPGLKMCIRDSSHTDGICPDSHYPELFRNGQYRIAAGQSGSAATAYYTVYYPGM